jgi:hypothetical protein
VVLFVPSVERDGITGIDQTYWVDAALEMFGRVFGGATAYPRARGIWRDDERGVLSSRTNRSLCIATRYLPTSKTRETSASSGASANGGAATRVRVRSVW